MQLDLYLTVLKTYKDLKGKNALLLDCLKQNKDHSDYDWTSHGIDTNRLTPEDLELLIKAHEANPLLMEKRTGLKGQLRTIKQLVKIRTGASQRSTNLKVVAELLSQHIAPMRLKWVFEDVDGNFDAWYVERIQYIPVQKRDHYVTPAHILLYLVAKKRGAKIERTIRIERADLGNGVSAVEMLNHLNLMPESSELHEQYLETIEVYKDYRSMEYEQFLARGTGETGVEDSSEDEEESRGWRSWRDEKLLKFEKVGERSKVVMDDNIGYGKKERTGYQDSVVYASPSFWENMNVDDDEEINDGEDSESIGRDDEQLFAPIQPYLCVFSLHADEFATTHVSNLEPYEYDETLADKLVLPPKHVGLLDILIKTSHKQTEDIVRGKRGGVIVLCSGEPGTGKTLTAETYSEKAKKPLYVTHCSQLGIEAKEIEKNLGIVLRRAKRWNAILLIDEADVYIHERGHDVNQNAIVGVFLRMLEYFSGVLFLTTNRATIIDDAIHSRCIAHIRYKLPNKDERSRVWEILATQYKVKLEKDLVKQLVRTFPTIAPRSIKQLCRLMQVMDEKPTLEKFIELAGYQENIKTVDEIEATQKEIKVRE